MLLLLLFRVARSMSKGVFQAEHSIESGRRTVALKAERGVVCVAIKREG